MSPCVCIKEVTQRRDRGENERRGREKPLYEQQLLNEVLRLDNDDSVGVSAENAFGQGLGRLFRVSDFLILEH